jgi:alkyl hydroperoxide reductase subunit AhpC
MGVLVGKKAPDFTAAAVLGDGTIVDSYSFSAAINGKYAVVFFYPLDFTFVCPSELIAFDHRLDEFKQRGVEVIGISIDSQYHPPCLEEHPGQQRRHRPGEIHHWWPTSSTKSAVPMMLNLPRPAWPSVAPS